MYRLRYIMEIWKWLDKTLDVVRRCMEESEQTPELMTLTIGFATLSHIAITCELPMGRREALAALMDGQRLDWNTADDKVDQMVEAFDWFSKRGDRTRNAGAIGSAEHSGWLAKCAYVLVSSRPIVTSAEVVASLSSVAELIEYCMLFDKVGACAMVNLMNPFVYIAQVCEKLGEHDKMLVYTTAALETDLTKAGTQLPSDRTHAYSMRGRAHAALGHTAEAAAAFESAAEEAHRYGYFLWEVFALRDLKLLVLDGMDHSEHGSRRLGAALRMLKGPASTLSPMLKGYDDAAQLMALPPPDSACVVVYEEESAETSLRRELSGLKLKALRQRAKAAGMSADGLESAMDSDDPEEALTVFLLEMVREARSYRGAASW